MKFNWHHVLAGEINRARYVERYGSFPHIHKESVAEHSYFVAFYSYLLWLETDREADLGKILLRALVHDMEESVTGDMLRAVKYSSEGLKEAMDEAGRTLLDDILTHIEAPAISTEGVRQERDETVELRREWENAKDRSLEGTIVAAADLLSVVSYAHIESQFGNRHAYSIRQEIGMNLQRLQEKIRFKRDELPETTKQKILRVTEDVLATLLMEYPHEGYPR